MAPLTRQSCNLMARATQTCLRSWFEGVPTESNRICNSQSRECTPATEPSCVGRVAHEAMRSTPSSKTVLAASPHRTPCLQVRFWAPKPAGMLQTVGTNVHSSNAEGRDKLGWSSNLPLFSIRCIVQSTRKIALPLFHRNLASVISHCDTNAWHAWCLTSAAKKGFCLLNRSVAPQQPSRSPNACKDKHWLNSPQNCPIGPRHDPPMLCKHPGIVASIGIPVMHWIHACCPKPSLHRGGVSKIGII